MVPWSRRYSLDPRHVRSLVNALLVAVLLAGADPKPPAVRATPITTEMTKWVSANAKKATEAQVLEKLGPPDSYTHADLTSSYRVIADMQLVWQDQAVIDVQMKDGKVVGLTARYAGCTGKKELAPENVLLV